ncbi:MAG TPA: hypothetical protein VLR52_04265 [Bacteroidales bacterium]|nr:hypothetical protein [Bacteroidales bacterium]
MKKFTVILPVDNDKQAYASLYDLIYNRDVVLFAVVGTDIWSEELVQPADRLAGKRQPIRRVVWIRNIEGVRNLIEKLFRESGVGSEVPFHSFAFSLSRDHKVCDFLYPTEGHISISRIDESFVAAE